MRLAVIPARGGSKRIPRKNIRPFCGRPMIAWSIEAAQRSGCFDRVVVSTDDEEIGEISKSLGADVPFVRPPVLADDHAVTAVVIKHAIEWFVQNDRMPTQVCCLYATAPFVRADDLKEGLKTLEAEDCDFVFPVASYPFPIQRAIRLTPAGRAEMFYQEHSVTRSQDLDEAYHDAGQFYWGRTEAWLELKAIFSPVSVPLIVPRYRVQDIDTLEDWRQAELLFRALHTDDADDESSHSH